MPSKAQLNAAVHASAHLRVDIEPVDIASGVRVNLVQCHGTGQPVNKEIPLAWRPAHILPNRLALRPLIDQRGQPSTRATLPRWGCCCPPTPLLARTIAYMTRVFKPDIRIFLAVCAALRVTCASLARYLRAFEPGIEVARLRFARKSEDRGLPDDGRAFREGTICYSVYCA